MPNAQKKAVATAKVICAHSKQPCSNPPELIAQPRNLAEQIPIGSQCGQVRDVGVSQPHPATSAQQSTVPPPKRNRLFYKNRWLISRDMVASLRRAGVECDIVVPALRGYDPTLLRH